MTGASTSGAGPVWISVEGVNGIGKTTAARAIARRVGARCLLLDELTDHSDGGGFARNVITALSARHDPFLRTGHPAAETLALLALQLRKTERLTATDLAGAEIVLEDRGVDSVAAYQAAILAQHHPGVSLIELARHLLGSTRPWRRHPDVTILLTGDTAVCARRFADRIGRPLTAGDLALLTQIDAVYRRMADDEPARYTVLDTTGWGPHEVTDAVGEVVVSVLDRRSAGVS
ncbi:dTMP kinase [Amycolatopsis thailandensis]|uniref:dTMP kinase n=1 Tax=Amycolatopsis thailandensis TaxID=589330 RepID=UPI0036258977